MRLIDADEALRMMQNSKTDNPFKKTFATVAWDLAHDSNISCVEACPTVDAVEVVRCKDCFADGCCSVQIDLDMGGDGYCSKGKRRTDNG